MAELLAFIKYKETKHNTYRMVGFCVSKEIIVKKDT